MPSLALADFIHVAGKSQPHWYSQAELAADGDQAIEKARDAAIEDALKEAEKVCKILDADGTLIQGMWAKILYRPQAPKMIVDCQENIFSDAHKESNHAGDCTATVTAVCRFANSFQNKD